MADADTVAVFEANTAVYRLFYIPVENVESRLSAVLSLSCPSAPMEGRILTCRHRRTRSKPKRGSNRSLVSNYVRGKAREVAVMHPKAQCDDCRLSDQHSTGEPHAGALINIVRLLGRAEGAYRSGLIARQPGNCRTSSSTCCKRLQDN